MTILTTPILEEIKVFDAEQTGEVRFSVIGGNQVVQNNLVVNRVSDGVEVYNGTQDAFNTYHIVPANTLVNGIDYRARIRTKDVRENWSSFSASVIFWCFSKPSLTIENIDYENQNRVYNQTVVFETTYKQKEKESLQSYKYLIYNSNRTLLQTFPERFVGASESLTQEVTGLQNGELYYIEVRTLSPNGNTGSSGLIHITPFYVTPTVNAVVTTKALPEKGAIKVSANIIQIIMKLYDNHGVEIPYDEIDYQNGDSLNLNRWDYQKLVADKGFDIAGSNFMIKVWAKDITSEKNIICLYGKDSQIEVFKKGNRIVAYKSIAGLSIRDYYSSEPYESTSKQEVLLIIRQENDVMDIIANPL